MPPKGSTKKKVCLVDGCGCHFPTTVLLDAHMIDVHNINQKPSGDEEVQEDDEIEELSIDARLHMLETSVASTNSMLLAVVSSLERLEVSRKAETDQNSVKSGVKCGQKKYSSGKPGYAESDEEEVGDLEEPEDYLDRLSDRNGRPTHEGYTPYAVTRNAKGDKFVVYRGPKGGLCYFDITKSPSGELNTKKRYLTSSMMVSGVYFLLPRKLLREIEKGLKKL